MNVTAVMVNIYALIDPRTGEIRYVGKTVKRLRTRLREHHRSAQKGRLTYVAKVVAGITAGRPPGENQAA